MNELRLHFLALAIVLSSATQLRVQAFPLGVGEAAIAACIAWRWLRWKCFDDVRSGRLFSLRLFGLAIVWVTLATWFAAQLSASSAADLDNLLSARIAAAIVLSVLFGESVFAMTPASGQRDRMYGLIVGWCALLSVAAMTAGHFGPAALRDFVWYEGGARLRALSDNPNQFGLLLTFSLLIVPLAFARARTAGGRMAIAAAGICILAAGMASRSDAMLLGVAAGTIPVALHLVSHSAVRAGLAHARLAAVGAALCAALILAPLVADVAIPLARSVFEQGNQGSDRLSLWQSAWQYFAGSPLLGGGPVPHARLDRIEGQLEAHNLFFDWAAMTGVVGLAILLLGLIVTASGVFRRGYWLHATPLVGIIVFSMFHFTLRQPVFWLSVGLAFSGAARLSAAERDASCAA